MVALQRGSFVFVLIFSIGLGACTNNPNLNQSAALDSVKLSTVALEAQGVGVRFKEGQIEPYAKAARFFTSDHRIGVRVLFEF